MTVAEIFDDEIALTIYNTLEAEFGNSLKIQVQGISNDSATDEDKEWLRADLLSADDLRFRSSSRRPGSIRAGLFQVTCSSRFHDRAVDKNHNRPWVIAKRVYRLFNKNSFTIIQQSSGNPLGCLSVVSGNTRYVDENEIAKSQVRGFLDPSNVHSVVVTFNYQASSN